MYAFACLCVRVYGGEGANTCSVHHRRFFLFITIFAHVFLEAPIGSWSCLGFSGYEGRERLHVGRWELRGGEGRLNQSQSRAAEYRRTQTTATDSTPPLPSASTHDTWITGCASGSQTNTQITVK